jgi:hypothetical protein
MRLTTYSERNIHNWCTVGRGPIIRGKPRYADKGHNTMKKLVATLVAAVFFAVPVMIANAPAEAREAQVATDNVQATKAKKKKVVKRKKAKRKKAKKKNVVKRKKAKKNKAKRTKKAKAPKKAAPKKKA